MRQLTGRDAERQSVAELLTERGCCLIVGAGGIGKSTLARSVADERRSSGRRVMWVDVEPLHHAEGLVAAVARALGVEVLPDEDSATAASAAIADQHGLLVLDGVEHVADEVAPLLSLWSQSAVEVLITSRVPIEGVTPVTRLLPLDIPPDDPLAGAAGRMLVDLVDALGRPGEDPSALAGVVRATGGLPLAVELAARQVARFGANFAGRYGALDSSNGEAIIDASVDRSLSQMPDEVVSVFRALGRSAGPVDVEMAAGLAQTSPAAALLALGTLVDHGLVFAVHDQFDLLPPIRDRAARLLTAAPVAGGSVDEVTAWAAQAAVGDGRDEPTSYRLFDRHVDTFILLAWQAVRAVADAPRPDLAAASAARLVNAMYVPLSARMHVRRLIALYTELFASIDALGSLDEGVPSIDPELEAHAARYAAMATAEGATIAVAETWLDRAERSAARVAEPDLVLGRIWSIRSVFLIEVGSLTRAAEIASQAIDASTRAGEEFFVAQSRRHLAEVALQRGELDEAERHVGELMAWARGQSTHHELVANSVLGWTLVERGDRAGAAALARAMRSGADRHLGYDDQVSVEADLIDITVDPSLLATTIEWSDDATWWLRLQQRLTRAGALPIDQHWVHVMHAAADVLVLADAVPLVQPRLSAGLLLGDAALAGGDVLQARLAYLQVMRDGVRRGYRLRVADAFDGISALAGHQRHDTLAGELAATADRIRDACGARPWVRPSLPTLWSGRRTPPAAWFSDGFPTLAAADQIERALLRHAPTVADSTLTKAERSVAQLVTEGLSNAEIASSLVVSRRTVESHLARIYRKLGIKNRTQLARLGITDTDASSRVNQPSGSQ